MAKQYDVSLREAVDLLGKKPATVRSYVRSGRLSKQYVDGFNGQEMRLNREELVELKEALKNSVVQGAERVSEEGTKNTVKDTPSNTHSKQTPADPNLARAIELLEKEITELRKEKESLRAEEKLVNEKNFQMAGQLGYFQNQVETLKDQVKQLSAPANENTAEKGSKKGLFSSLFGTGKR